MAFPTTPVLENFTGSNGTSPPNSNWTNSVDGHAGLEIQSNMVQPVGATYGCAWWNPTTFGPDQEAYALIGSKSDENDRVALFLRVTQPGGGTWDGYIVRLDTVLAGTDTIEIYEVTDNVFTPMGPGFAQEFASGDSLGASIVGSSLQVYRKPAAGAWGAIGSPETNSAHAGAGFIGLELRNANANPVPMRVDSFGGGTYSAGLLYTDTGWAKAGAVGAGPKQFIPAAGIVKAGKGIAGRP